VVRPLGDVVVLMPPLAMTEAELTRLVAATAEAIDEATAAALSLRRSFVADGCDK
jgi:adenosylmethionine-8-amino-7-oxononanoate aminotransferase